MNSAATAEAKIAPLVPLFMTFSIFRSAESLRLGGYRRESRDAGASVTLDNDSYSALRRKSYTAVYDGLKNARCGNFCGVEGYFSELKEAPAQMFNFKFLAGLAEKTLERLASFEWLAALLVRLFVGYFFLETGWGK